MQSLRSFISFELHSCDGKIGHISDFLIQEENWSVEYAVAAVGGMLSAARLLVPMAELTVSPLGKEFSTQKTTTELETLSPPDLVTKFEEGQGLEDDPSTPNTAATVIDQLKSPWLSFGHILAAKIETPDGQYGVVDDVLLDLTDWRVQYIVGRSYDWKRKPTVLISTAWVKEVDWSGQTLAVSPSLKALEENDPSYKPSSHT